MRYPPTEKDALLLDCWVLTIIQHKLLAVKLLL